MMGYNCSEGMLALPNAFNKWDTFENDLQRLIPKSLCVEADSVEGLELTKSIRNQYFQNKRVNENTMQEFIKLETDFLFAIHAVITAELYARKQHRFLLSMEENKMFNYII